jgi:hypothetical protein
VSVSAKLPAWSPGIHYVVVHTEEAVYIKKLLVKYGIKEPCEEVTASLVTLLGFRSSSSADTAGRCVEEWHKPLGSPSANVRVDEYTNFPKGCKWTMPVTLHWDVEVTLPAVTGLVIDCHNLGGS